MIEGEVYEHPRDPGITAFVLGLGEDGRMELAIAFESSDMELEEFEELFGVTLPGFPAIDPVRRSAQKRVQEWIDGERVAL